MNRLLTKSQRYKHPLLLKSLIVKKLALRITFNKSVQISEDEYSESFRNFCFNLVKLKNLEEIEVDFQIDDSFRNPNSLENFCMQ